MDKSHYNTVSKKSVTPPFNQPSLHVALPSGHTYFSDCLRENNARFIAWSLTRGDADSWFSTFTFKDYQREFGAMLLFNKWAGHLSQALNFNNRSARLRWITVKEWQKRDVIHLHSLIQGKGLGSLSRKRWEYRWESLGRNTGFCRIYDADRKAAPYLAKYTSKALGGDINVGGYWRGLEAPASITCGHS